MIENEQYFIIWIISSKCMVEFHFQQKKKKQTNKQTKKKEKKRITCSVSRWFGIIKKKTRTFHDILLATWWKKTGKRVSKSISLVKITVIQVFHTISLYLYSYMYGSYTYTCCGQSISQVVLGFHLDSLNTKLNFSGYV